MKAEKSTTSAQPVSPTVSEWSIALPHPAYQPSHNHAKTGLPTMNDFGLHSGVHST